MKRWISFLTAAALLLTTVPASYLKVQAEEPLPDGSEVVSTVTEDTTDPSTEAAGQGTLDPPGQQDGSEDLSGDSSASGELSDGGGEEPPAGDMSQAGSTEGDPYREESDEGDSLPINIGEDYGIAPISTLQNTGEVVVTVEAGLFFGQEIPFTVTLTSKAGELDGSYEQTLTLPVPAEESTKPASASVKFGELPDGNYQVVVNADGFVKYTQDVEVKDQLTYELRLMAGELLAMGSENASTPGLILIGDVTGDEEINEEDQAQVLDKVDAAYMDPQMNKSCPEDLNQDGLLDLTDFAYLAKGFGQEQQSAKPQVSVPVAMVSSGEGAGTKAEGTLQISELVNNTDNTKTVEFKAVDTAGEPVEISSQHPVNVDFELAPEDGVEMDGIVIATGRANPMNAGYVTIEYVEDGESGTLKVEPKSKKTKTVPVANGIHFLTETDVTAEIDANGNLIVDLGEKVAVKKVSLTITAMTNNNNLAEISKVEFVNGMENRIPEPTLDIPEGLAGTGANREFTVTWEPCVNVTGYEVRVRTDVKGQEVSEVVHVNDCTLNVSSFGGDKLNNYQVYKVSVQSANGTWRSGYSEEIEVTPKPTSLPDKPDNLKVTGGYRSISVSWKAMSDAEFYNVYFKKSSDEEFELCSERQTANSFVIENLEDQVEYTVCVSSINDYGEGPKSLPGSATTTNVNPADMPKYKLINVGAPGENDCHIVSVSRKGGEMIDSKLDTDTQADSNGFMSAWGAVDKDPVSAYYKNEWSDGGWWDLQSNGVYVEFDQEYTLDNIAFQELTAQGMSYEYVKVRAWDAQGNEVYKAPASTSNNAVIRKRTDSQGRVYYRIQLDEPVTAKRLQIGVARYYYGATVSISEMYFYHYDSLLNEILDLYADGLHTKLKDSVSQKDIDALRERVNTPDEVSKEYSPDQKIMLDELDTAEKILNDKALHESMEVHNTITTSDIGRGFGGLNAWQPLGVVAAEGEELTVYVGHNTKLTGESTNLQLVATQYHAESSSMSKVVQDLKVGANQVTIPKIWDLDIESGGALYVQYTGNNANDQYAVRVSGGVKVPKLDLYQVTDPAERLSRAKTYVEELKEYTADLEKKHEELHAGSKLPSVNKYGYTKENCILGASDILLDTMMLSLPAQQILAGAEAKAGASIDAQAEQIVSSMDAMEEMMYLFYQHKGLNADAKDEIDRIPKRHLNIRYQRMFSGAFMYAGGDHIGIEYPETAGMVGATPVENENGKYVSGGYFGWGIAHEIGHCINQNAYAVAEVTNNYFAVLAQAKETNESVRFEYDNVYKKVTSGAKGSASNVFTQLGMYWQLHLAYDNGYNYMTYKEHEAQKNSLFFARVDTYARRPATAPKPNGIELKLSNNKDQDLMRLSCAAAGKNILEFFERWGKTPDEDTIAYASQFEKETRALYYVNDEAREYRLTSGAESGLAADGTTLAVGEGTTAAVDSNQANKVNFTLQNTLQNPNDLLGYEIIRGTISGGQLTKEVVGFSTTSSYSDVVSVMNNRVVYYEVAVIDKYLNRSAPMALAPIKISHDGSLDKTDWTASTVNMTEVSKIDPGKGTKEDPCDPEPVDSATLMIDNQVETTYIGEVEKAKDEKAEDAEIILEFNKELVITGFKYTASDTPIGSFTALVRQVDGTWTEVAKGSFDKSAPAAGQTVYFESPENEQDGKYINTYSATALKLVLGKADTLKGTKVTVSELDVLGVSGDNTDLREATELPGGGSVPAIGRLSEDYVYGSDPEDRIPKDSIIFLGSYKGNAAYNVVLLYDQDGRIVGGVDAQGNVNADQIIMADVPDQGNIADVKDGVWIYWIKPNADVSAIKSVRAELYRVNNALTNEGQRLVSDSLPVTMPETLPAVTLTGGGLKPSGSE